MTNFAQKHPKLTTFHQLSDGTDLHQQLMGHARWKKPVLIIPALASEFNQEENRPVFENILHELRRARYLAKIIIGVDRATENDIQLLREILDQNGVRDFFIQWNDGPGFISIYERLTRAGLDLSVRGKGRNLFMGFGVAIALGATAVGLLDADIKTFKKRQLDRLFSRLWFSTISFPRLFMPDGTEAACMAGSKGSCSTRCFWP
jgi:glucosyl-3-phosphoglycerate synthase